MADVNYLNTIPLGKIQRFEYHKATSISAVSFPGQDSSWVEGIDTLGVVGYLSIKGRFTGTVLEIQSYIASLNSVVDGLQTGSSEFISPFVNSNKYDNSTPPVREVRKGTISQTTAYVANKLYDANAVFESNNHDTNDVVKNFVTGEIGYVGAVDSQNQISIVDAGGSSLNLFPETSPFQAIHYAVSANINVKVIDFNVIWELPGLTWCDYTLELLQVR